MLLQLFEYCPRTARLAVLTVFMFAATPTHGGQEWTCKKKGLVRQILIQADVYGKPPCKTIYLKPTEKKPERMLARADHDFPLCERKAEELALKLQNMSWECSRKDS